MILELKKITKSFKIDKQTTFTALKQLDLSFDKGEFVSILGPSGCGKSTLLNIIAGLDFPTKGELIIDGKSTKRYKLNDWDVYRKYNIGFVFQQFNLIEHLSALENVELVMTLIGLSKKQRHDRAMELLSQVGIDAYADHLPGQLSGGQKQRVAIARALANNPDIILADEPTGALDTETGLSIMELLKSIADDKLVIMVTHNRQLAFDYSTRVISMLDGEVQSIETIKNANLDVQATSLTKKNRSMPFKEAFKLSLRNMKKKIGRVAITAIAGSIGIAGITLVSGLGVGANQFIDEQIVRFGNANVLNVSSNYRNDENQIVYQTDISHFDNIRKLDDVALIRPSLDVSNVTWSIDAKTVDARVQAYAPFEYLDSLSSFVIGSLPTQSNELLINQSTARNLIALLGLNKETPIKDMIGKELTLGVALPGLTQTRSFTIVGIMDEIDLNMSSIYFNNDDMIDFYKSIQLPGGTTFYDQVTKADATSFEVIVKDVVNTPSVASWINDPANGGVGNGFAASNKLGRQANNIAMSFKNALSTVINLVQVVMVVFLVVAMVVSSILIAIVLFSSILERRVEIGILKAVGARNKDVMRVFQSEAILLGLFSGLLGILFAFALIPIAEPIVSSLTGFDATGFIQIPLMGTLIGTNIQIPGLFLITLVLISTVVAAIAGYLPSRKATKMQVIDALRDE